MDLLINSAGWNAGPLVVIDGGARETVFEPMDRVRNDRRIVVRFEPDADANVIGGDGEVIMRKALWSGPARIPLHVTRAPSCSSVYPPDERLLAHFVDVLGLEARRVMKKVEVEADSIDNTLREQNLAGADFIKLDIHSAEYEALQGAEESLRTSTLGVLVECWPLPIHRGQHTFAELDALMTSKGFLPFEIAVARWPKKIDGRVTTKSEVTQYEILYLRDVLGQPWMGGTPNHAAKLVAIAELFGHVTHAIHLANDLERSSVLPKGQGAAMAAQIARAHRLPKWRHLASKVARKVQRMLDRVVVSSSEA